MGTQPRHSFAIKTCSQMAQKLHRELGRLGLQASDPDNPSDHAINFALTAWLMTEWVWRMHFDGDRAIQDALVPMASPLRNQKNAGEDIPPKWFKDFLRQECLGLTLCQDIANGTKHTEFTYPPEIARTTMSAAMVPSMVLGVGRLGEAALTDDGQPVSTYRPKAFYNSRGKRDVLTEFDAVTIFWDDFLKTHNIP